MTDPKSGASRREFLKASAAAGAAAAHLGFVPAVHAQGDETIKVGVVGCGGRGTGAAENCCEADKSVKIVAIGDLFPDRIDACRSNLKKLGEQFDVPEDRAFTGFDAYQKVLDQDIDLVILATPPGFRPGHLAAAVKAGKHIFTEKPVGVDGPGIRQAIAAAEEAKGKKLSIVAGTQRRHEAPYLEAMKRIHDGELGELTSGRCYWLQGPLWVKPKESQWSDMEWQVRNWLYFVWLSGDHICEQHVHNLDVINWAFDAHPVRAVGMGGRLVRTQPEYGHIYDHFAIDFEYPNEAHVLSMCRQIEGCENNVSEAVVGTKGRWTSAGQRFTVDGKDSRVRARGINPYVQEHVDLIASIRKGEGLNELKRVAESTLTAIMGRMSAYSGEAVTWEQALSSKVETMPRELAFGPLPVPPVPMPNVVEVG